MKIGWVGLGKLGLPCAAVLALHHQVVGTDRNPDIEKYLTGAEDIPYQEEGLTELLDETWQRGSFTWTPDIAGVVSESDVVFVAVQTPHAPVFEGDRPMPSERADFDYSYLRAAVAEVARAAEAHDRQITIVVVSTVLPGTCDRILRPLIDRRWMRLAYSPAFIAMGTAVADFALPEMVLIGADDGETHRQVAAVFEPIHDAPAMWLSIPSAELAKVAYNTYIGQKIVFANTIMEICHKTGADADDVIDALAQATDRLHSPAYLRGGMGDGGGCHPRDNIAMSWLAQRLDLSVDWFSEIMEAREAQTKWLADLASHHADVADLDIVVMGRAYKAGSNLTAGSPARLLMGYLGWGTKSWDPHLDFEDGIPTEAAVYVIATRHREFSRFEYPVGSVVIDPWGYIEDRPGVTVIRVGRKT